MTNIPVYSKIITAMQIPESINKKQPDSDIIVKRDVLNMPDPESCMFLPLPNRDSKSWQHLFELLEWGYNARSVEIGVDKDLIKKFDNFYWIPRTYRAHYLIDRYNKNEIPVNDVGAVYDLMRVTREAFEYTYYRRKTKDGNEKWEYINEYREDIDEELWQEFSDRRDLFIKTFLEDIHFDNRFFVAREIQIGGFKLPIKSDVLMIAGFDKWWIGEVKDPGAESGYSQALYIPINPTLNSLAEFVIKNGMAIWQITDESFTRENVGLWGFSYSRESVLRMYEESYFTDRTRLISQKDDPYIIDMALITKLTAHLAGIWDIARIIRHFKRNNIPILQKAFTNLYNKRVTMLMESVSGEDFASSLSASPALDIDDISPVGHIPGYQEDKKEPVDPIENSLTKYTDVFDLIEFFAKPGNIQYVLDINEGRNPETIDSLISSLPRVQISTEDDFKKIIRKISYLPLSFIDTDEI